MSFTSCNCMITEMCPDNQLFGLLCFFSKEAVVVLPLFVVVPGTQSSLKRYP